MHNLNPRSLRSRITQPTAAFSLLVYSSRAATRRRLLATQSEGREQKTADSPLWVPRLLERLCARRFRVVVASNLLPFAAREIQPCPTVRGCRLEEIDNFRESRRDNLLALVGGSQEHGFMMNMVIEISSTCLRAQRLTTWISQKTFRSRPEAQVVRNSNVKSS